jgi:chorismate dehydratase
MAYPIAMIPYANMAPYRAAGVPSGCHFVSLVPSASVTALAEAKVWAAAVPVAALPALGTTVEPLGRFGIAARGSCLSVLFFSQRPFATMHMQDRLCITGESTTSVQLLRLLLRRSPGTPRTSEPGGEPSGELVIGDRALAECHARQAGPSASRRSPLARFPYMSDLAEAWYKKVALPFVFARWVVHREAPAACRQALGDWLAEFQAREGVWVQRAVAHAAARSGLPEPLIQDYFAKIRRTLSDDDLAGQRCFLDQLAALDRGGRVRQCRTRTA